MAHRLGAAGPCGKPCHRVRGNAGASPLDGGQARSPRARGIFPPRQRHWPWLNASHAHARPLSPCPGPCPCRRRPCPCACPAHVGDEPATGHAPEPSSTPAPPRPTRHAAGPDRRALPPRPDHDRPRPPGPAGQRPGDPVARHRHRPCHRRITLADRPGLPFDVASIDIGIGSDLPDIPGSADHATAAKPLGAYAERWESSWPAACPPRALSSSAPVSAGWNLPSPPPTACGPKGRTPDHRPRTRRHPSAQHRRRRPRHASAPRRTGRHHLPPRHHRRPDRRDQRHFANREILPSDFTLSVAGTRPQAWLAETGLDTHDGFLTVSPSLQTSDPAIFAAGDCAHMAHAPRPKAGVFAVRQAPVLHHNLRAALSGAPLRAYRPQKDYLKLVSPAGATRLPTSSASARAGPGSGA